MGGIFYSHMHGKTKHKTGQGGGLQESLLQGHFCSGSGGVNVLMRHRGYLDEYIAFDVCE